MRPQGISHGVQPAEVDTGAQGIVAIEQNALVSRFQQPPAQGSLQEPEPHLRFQSGSFWMRPSPCGPARLDLADPICDDLVIDPVWPAMQRQAMMDRGLIAGGQQQAVEAKIVVAKRIPTHRLHQFTKAFAPPQLQRKKMMTLHPRHIAGPPASVYVSKMNNLAHGRFQS